MELIVTTPDEIRAIFNDCLRNANLISKPDPPKKQELERPISQPEAIEFLGKSRQTLIAWRKKGIIRGHKLSGRIYYLKSELLAAIKSNI
ncbi:MAG TPA: helix-turn-helix domain-containing protein [Bacteroidales bacterium]|nr:helix-turn-helix domain-containing protein [Bacteroidales bacterium]